MTKPYKNNNEKSSRFIEGVFGLILYLLIYVGMVHGQGIDSTNCVTIDFETVPGDTVAEGLIISDQYLDSLGISFKLEDSTYMFPRIAEVGAPRTAFAAFYGADTPDPDQNTGNFFLTDDGLTSGNQAQPLIVDLSYPADSISGYVLDIDYNETFTIIVRDSMNLSIDSVVISAGDPETGDGKATPWSFKRGIPDIFSIKFEGSRTAAGFFGLGFDNFCSCSPSRTTTALEDWSNNDVLLSYSLNQNYPNPFNPTTTINYSIPQSSNVTIKIYDVLGNEMEILVNDFKNAGTYELQWNAENLTSGVYFYRVTAGSFIETRKMILLR